MAWKATASCNGPTHKNGIGQAKEEGGKNRHKGACQGTGMTRQQDAIAGKERHEERAKARRGHEAQRLRDGAALAKVIMHERQERPTRKREEQNEHDGNVHSRRPPAV